MSPDSERRSSGVSKVMHTAARASMERTCTDSSKSAWLDELPACFLYSAIRSLQTETMRVRLQQWPSEVCTSQHGCTCALGCPPGSSKIAAHQDP